ncbi:uncharacterized protein Z518_03734 [Rhinocladiella mackenziei CBS 650.93]|uniref:Rhinocladiella mackenziei CBS 650.93 unplaced genomic scaffold supercont1.3, whole genome shotgun sequence n=1 Tax=Rhinocladiella mackenziei CBS 650.93 TaxID=1442369 RepID=A0A0D2FUH9_9EURO|nr:uncharacterized protein Z518_03734 [Rhinocladiella mackenziei CBS 650.93]KIX05762.1 hypothetical protein Z518_03734 [Rhinocladiella mackenziei CBS 650.93]
MFSAAMFRLLSLANILVAISLVLADHTPVKSFPSADLGWNGLRKAYNDLQPNLTDLLAVGDLDKDPVLEKAMHLIDNLVTQSTCHQAAAAQLLMTCKGAGKDFPEGQGKHELLERAKSVYAVRVAVCETGEGRAAVPAACKTILDVPQRPHNEIDVVGGQALSSCVEALMLKHYYWTSYSNSRQNANTLCQAGTLEATRLEALHSYQKLFELLPEFRDTLKTTRSQWQSFLRQQEEDARKVNKLQQAHRDELNQQHKTGLSALRDAMSMAKKGLEDVSQALQLSVAGTGADITQTRAALGDVLADFTVLRNMLHEAIQTISQNNAEVAAIQEKNMHNMHKLAVATVQALKHLQAGEVVQGVDELLYRVKAEMHQIVAAQSMQLSNAEQHLKLSEELSQAQKANLIWGQQMRDSSVSLASELDSASVVADRVSSRLENVNQALTQVEKASLVLSAFFGLMTIPSQMLEHLHLNLLGVFAMPSIVLYFWKPRRYPYSLMAIYVFLESVISCIAEYRATFSTSFGRVGGQSRAILKRSLQIFNQNQYLACIGILFLVCSSLLIAFLRRKSKISTSFKITKPDENYAFANRYYRECHLRNGICLQPVERYRRAATVG